jgi:hypothetical protein
VQWHHSRMLVMSCGYSATSRSRGIKRRSRQRLAYGTSILFHALGRDGRLLELVRALWTLDRGSSVDLPERRRVCAFAFCSAFGTQLDRGVPTSRRRGGGETSARPRGSDSSNQIKSDRGGGGGVDASCSRPPAWFRFLTGTDARHRGHQLLCGWCAMACGCRRPAGAAGAVMARHRLR